MGMSDLITSGINKGYSVKFAKDMKITINKCKLSFYNDFIRAYNHIQKMKEDSSLSNDEIVNSIIEGYGENLTPIKIMDFHLKKDDKIYENNKEWCQTYGGRYPDSIKVLESFGDFYNKMISIKEAMVEGNATALESFYINARADKELLEKEGTNLEKDNSKSGPSWGVCIVLVFLLPPIGIILCLMKALKKKK